MSIEINPSSPSKFEKASNPSNLDPWRDDLVRLRERILERFDLDYVNLLPLEAADLEYSRFIELFTRESYQVRRGIPEGYITVRGEEGVIRFVSPSEGTYGHIRLLPGQSIGGILERMEISYYFDDAYYNEVDKVAKDPTKPIQTDQYRRHFGIFLILRNPSTTTQENGKVEFESLKCEMAYVPLHDKKFSLRWATSGIADYNVNYMVDPSLLKDE